MWHTSIRSRSYPNDDLVGVVIALPALADRKFVSGETVLTVDDVDVIAMQSESPLCDLQCIWCPGISFAPIHSAICRSVSLFGDCVGDNSMCARASKIYVGRIERSLVTLTSVFGAVQNGTVLF